MTFNEMKMYPKIMLSPLGYNQINIYPNQTSNNDCKPVVNSPRKSFKVHLTPKNFSVANN